MKSIFALTLSVLLLKVNGESEIKMPPELKELLDNFHGVCVDQTGVSQSVVDEVHKANFQEDPKLKCYFKCMMQQLQAMTEDGKLDIEFLEASIPDELKQHGALEAIKNCQHITAPEICETAFQMIKCLHKQNAKLSAMFE